MRANIITFINKQWPTIIVGCGIVAYTVFFSWFTINRAANFNAGWYDLGIMSQTAWNVGHGYGFNFTNPEAGPGGVHGLTSPRTAIHADYILILLAPLSWFGQTWVNLLIFQALILGLGAWFVYRLARKLLGRTSLGLILAAAYLLYPPLQFANLFEFHAVVLAVTFFLAAADAILNDRWRWFWVWAGLALITKEQVGISLALLAGFLWWRQHRPKRAIIAMGICLIYTVLQLFVVIPLSRPGQTGSFVYDKFYPSSSEGGTAVVGQLTNPRKAWGKLYTPTHRHDLVQLLTPLGVVGPILSPLSYLVIPEMLLYWLSDSPNQQTLFLHYHALTIPFLFIGLMLAWRWLFERINARRPKVGRAVLGLLLVLLVSGSGYSVWRFSMWPWSPITRWPLISWKERQTADVKAALAMIPSTATVAVTQNLGPQVSERPVVKLLPSGAGDTDYLMILQRSFGANTDTNDKRWAEKLMLDLLIEWLNRQPTVKMRYHVGRVWLFERTGRSTEPEPTWPNNLLGR